MGVRDNGSRCAMLRGLAQAGAESLLPVPSVVQDTGLEMDQMRSRLWCKPIYVRRAGAGA